MYTVLYVLFLLNSLQIYSLMTDKLQIIIAITFPYLIKYTFLCFKVFSTYLVFQLNFLINCRFCIITPRIISRYIYLPDGFSYSIWGYGTRTWPNGIIFIFIPAAFYPKLINIFSILRIWLDNYRCAVNNNPRRF